MNDIDPHAWLADVLARLPNTTASYARSSALELAAMGAPARSITAAYAGWLHTAAISKSHATPGVTIPETSRKLE